MSKNKKAYSREAREKRNFYRLVLPAFIIFALVIIVPFFLGFYYSLTDWKSVTQTNLQFVGLKNFTDSLSDTRFQYSLMITVIFALFNVIVINIVSFGLALLVSSKIKLKDIFRAGFFIPNLIGGLVLGYIWQFIYNSVFPALGQMIGSDFLINNLFLGDVKLAVTALIITNTWQYAGYIMMIYFAALQNVPSSLVESASLDGANAWQRLRHIIIPMVMPAFTVSLFLTITTSFKIFDVNFSLTGGGPSLLWHDKAIQSTEFITMNIFNTASGDNLMAQGQARAVILFFILVVISLIQTSITKRKEIDL